MNCAERPDWQSHICGIGVLEFVQLDDQTPFIGGINQFLDDSSQFYQLATDDSHSRAAFVHSGLRRELSLPDEYGRIFDHVYVTDVTDTNRLCRIILYGEIDEQAFREARIEDHDENNQHLQLENAGLSVLRDSEAKLSEFLQNEVGAGFITDHATKWSSRNEHSLNHPGFWFYDLSETTFSTVEDLWDRRQEGTLFMGMGRGDHIEQGITTYSNDRCLINGDGRRYFNTPLGNFPFRYLLIRLQEEDVSDGPLGRVLNPDRGIPVDVEQGCAALARSYVHLFWSLDTYSRIPDHSPEQVLPDSESVQTVLEGLSDHEVASLLDELYEQNRGMDTFWVDRQEQFESIRTTRREFSNVAIDERTVVGPLLTAAKDIENLCENRIERMERRYKRLTERIHVHLDVTTGIAVKQLTAILFLLTFLNVIAQIPGIFPGTGTFLSFNLLLLLGAVLVIFPLPRRYGNQMLHELRRRIPPGE